MAAVARTTVINPIVCAKGDSEINLNGKNCEAMKALVKKIKESMRTNSVFAAVGIGDKVNTYVIESVDPSNASIIIIKCVYKKTLLIESPSDTKSNPDFNSKQAYYFSDIYDKGETSTLNVSDLVCLQVRSIFPKNSIKPDPDSYHIWIPYDSKVPMILKEEEEMGEYVMVSRV
ncbi:MAG: hypothetical protein HZB76_00640 [Chlamydiae bacterium]|nr:hypothetical protein [Chlamydiota bacterium]